MFYSLSEAASSVLAVATISGSAAVSGVVSSVGEGALDLETCLSSAVIASADGFELSLT